MQSSVIEARAQRRLILIRHAKAVEDDGRGDHARPLSEKGEASAVLLGQWLAAKQWIPQLALCSSAMRTRQTLAALGKNIPTLLNDKLYLASAGEMLTQIQHTDDAIATLMLIGHNPGMHALLAMLVGDYTQDADAERILQPFPTSACALLTFSGISWQHTAPADALLESLRY